MSRPAPSLLRPPLTTEYGVDLRIFRTAGTRLGFGALVVAVVALPLYADPFWLSVANFAQLAAIGALGLNVVAGDAGLVSLGHAFFIGIGGYAAAYLNGIGWPFPLWVLAGGVVAAIASGLVGPLTLRLRGLYLAFATVALVFIGQYLFVNVTPVTGGGAGRAVEPPELFGAEITQRTTFLGRTWTGDQKWFYLILPVLVVFALMLRNLQRTRLGRSFRAVRDQDVAAWVTGIPLARTKVTAFALSAFLGGVGGALLASYLRFITPDQFGLLLSVNYLAMIIVGGMGSVSGAILGAAFIVALPRAINRVSEHIPFVQSSLEAQGAGLTPELLATMIYGAVVIAFLVLEPDGLVGVLRRIRAYFRAWPYRY